MKQRASRKQQNTTINKLDNLALNTKHISYKTQINNLSNYYSTTPSAHMRQPIQTYKKAHPHFARFAKNNTCNNIVKFKIRDIPNLPSRLRTHNQINQKSQPINNTTQEKVAVRFKTKIIPNLPKHFQLKQGIDQISLKPQVKPKSNMTNSKRNTVQNMCKATQTREFDNVNRIVNHKKIALRNTEQLKPEYNNQINNKSRRTARRKGEYIGFMCPQGPALDHPMAEMLLAYAEKGCTVNCGENWTKEHVNAAIAWGFHISANDRDAIAYVWQKAREKQE